MVNDLFRYRLELRHMLIDNNCSLIIAATTPHRKSPTSRQPSTSTVESDKIHNNLITQGATSSNKARYVGYACRSVVGSDFKVRSVHDRSSSRVNRCRCRVHNMVVVALGRRLARVAATGDKTTRQERTLPTRLGETAASGRSQRRK